MLVVAVAAAVGGCGSSAEPPPPAEPAESPPLAAEPVGRVVDVGSMPEGIAADAATATVVLGLRDPDRLVIVEGRSGDVTGRLALPGAPRHLQLAAPGGPVLVPAEGADTLIEVTLPEGRVTSRARVGDFPHDATATGTRRFVADEFGDSVSVVEQGRAVASLEAPVQPGGIAALGNDSVGVVAVRDNVLRVFDAQTLEQRSETSAGAGPMHVVADPVSERFYVADTRGEALLFTTFADEPQILDRLNLPSPPYGLAIDPRGRRIWVTLPATNELAEVELEGNEPTLTATYPTVRQPNTVAVDPRSDTVYVASRTEGTLQIIAAGER